MRLDEPRTVLIADDDRQLRTLLAEFLTTEGFEVLQASDGVEALQAVEMGRPDVMLLDIMMPRLGGLRTLDAIHAFDPNLPVVVMTGTLDAETLRRAIFSGATTVLTKPLQLEDVAAAIRGQSCLTRDGVPPAGPSRRTGTRKVLVVDDEPQVRATIQEILRGSGYDVRVAVDGASALAAVSADPPDVVLLDVQMPGLNGIDVLAAIRAIDPTIKLIMVTGVTRQQVADEAFEHGVFDYIGKPVDPAYLELSIETALTTDAD
jgi:DNA-binding NtrC family response regulator